MGGLIVFIIVMAIVYSYTHAYNQRRNTTNSQQANAQRVVVEPPKNTHPLYVNETIADIQPEDEPIIDIGPGSPVYTTPLYYQVENQSTLDKGLRYERGTDLLSGMRISICPYCGAENQIPMYGQEQRKCYFCYTKLTNE